MEATQKNLVNDASVSQKLSGIYPKFDLDKSYTALRMNVKGDFVSVLPVPSLSRNSVWKANRVMYRGVLSRCRKKEKSVLRRRGCNGAGSVHFIDTVSDRHDGTVQFDQYVYGTEHDLTCIAADRAEHCTGKL